MESERPRAGSGSGGGRTGAFPIEVPPARKIGQSPGAGPPEPGDARVAAIAARQRGVIAPAQLRAAGLSRAAVSHRIARGRLHPYIAGALLVGHAAPAPLAAETAALLMCGPDPLLSHTAAAALSGIHAAGGRVHVTVARNGSSARRGVVIHRVTHLHPADRTTIRGLPVTAAARTLVDLAGLVDANALDAALERARASGLVRPADVLAALARAPSRRGAGTLRRLVEARPTLTRSEAERRLLGLVRLAGLPRPETNVRVGRHEVDLLWRTERLVVEVDGYAYHAGREAFERDRRRDAELQAAGLRVIRVTWRRIVREPEALIAILAQALVRA